MIEVIFIFSLFMLFYIYAGYPLVAGVYGFVAPRPLCNGLVFPTVSVLISAYNEEDVIAATIENKLGQDYPHNKLEIIVVSDGSDDRTDKIVEAFAVRGVKLLRQDPRAGKTSALNLAVTHASGEIIVFSDANSIYAPDALRHLTANFADPSVGYVTGSMIFANPDGTPIGDGCSSYMKYENTLRTIETRIGSVVGVDGGIDAVRKKLYHPMRGDQLPDFVLPLKIVEQGYRVVYEPNAILRELSLKSGQDEYRMRVRVSLRSFWALFDMRHLLGPKVNLLFAWQLWSHKLLRYLCFVFLVSAYTTNMLLLGKGTGYVILFLIQNAGYLLAFFTPYLERIGKKSWLFSLARYFFLINLAAAHAFCKFMVGKKQVIWTPRKG